MRLKKKEAQNYKAATKEVRLNDSANIIKNSQQFFFQFFHNIVYHSIINYVHTKFGFGIWILFFTTIVKMNCYLQVK